MKTIRKILFKLLGYKKTLSILSKIYIHLINAGFLKTKYPELFYLKKIIKPGDTCIDIGANLGYYSVQMSKLTGINGKVYSVEPVPMFNQIWTNNVKLSGIKNLQLMPYALGQTDCTVKMGMPERDGIAHHGMTKIVSTAADKYVKYFDVDMKNPDVLFAGLNKINFIKCDIEGYEYIAFSNMAKTLKKHMPLIQSELSGNENRQNAITFFESLGYQTCLLQNNSLKIANQQQKNNSANDFYFVSEPYKNLIN